jgi:hypothetical protein
VTRRREPDDDRGELDDLDRAVEEEYQEAVRVYRASPSGTTIFPTSRQAIRKRRLREHREAAEARLLALQIEALEEGRRTPEKPEPDARRERSRIPLSAFWLILEQRVKSGKLATVNSLSEQTRRRANVDFVGRTRVTKLVNWIDEHPEQARRAWELHDIPAGFRATRDGIIVP